MSFRRVLCIIGLLIVWASSAQAVTLTFDDIPQGQDLRYYEEKHNVGFSFEFTIVDHTKSSWGTPHSESNVLRIAYPPPMGYSFMGVKRFDNPSDPRPLYAYSVGGYFSTEPGVVLEMIGYDGWNPLVSTTIGAPGQSWNNVYVDIGHTTGMNFVVFRPVTSDALMHFCVDDMTIVPVPEPSSLLALASGLGSLGIAWSRRKLPRA